MSTFELETYLAEDCAEEYPILVEVTYNVHGSYRPATWGYYGGEPEEGPEMEIESIEVVDDTAPGGFEFGSVLGEDELVGGVDAVMAAAWREAESLRDCY